MTNENKKINELVENDSDPTSECEALTARQFHYDPGAAPALETEERTHAVNDVETASAGPGYGQDTDPAARTEVIERLRYELEQVRGKWLGLKAEIQSREELAGRLETDLRDARGKLEEAFTLLARREATLERLRARIEAQTVEHGNLKRLFEQTRMAKTELESGGEISAARDQLVRYEGAVAGLEAELSGLRDQQRQTESYADTLRRQLSDLRAGSRSVFGERDALRVELANSRSTILTLEARLAATVRRAESAERALAAVRDVHEQELRLLRFELSEAQETLAESSQVTEQLACDLAQNRGQRIELERVLTDHEQRNQDKIEALQKQVGQLEKTLADYERKLETKSNAITALMNELSRQSSATTSEEINDQTLLGAGRPSQADRVTRLLIGHFGKQELRFPLFKNRLTIGRTRENDIYLKAEFISRHHAVIVTDSQATRIIDWGSKNGVYVNSKRVTEHFLKSGDRIRIGPVEFRYEELPRRESA
jgi:predicted  nucleic acid-binding Zn-ribbon protein